MSNMVVQTNVLALNAHRNIKVIGAKQSNASQKLSSGYRINNAADDAAGLAISEKMRSQIRGLDMASKNASDGQSLINTAEGGLQEIDNMLQRIRELTVQASTDTNDQATETDIQGDRRKIQDEIDSLTAEIDSMAERVEFNKKKVISGAYSDGETAESLMGKLGGTSTTASGGATAELRKYTKAELAELKSLATAMQDAGFTASVQAAMSDLGVANADVVAVSLSVFAASVFDAIDSGKTGTALDNAIAKAYKDFLAVADVKTLMTTGDGQQKAPVTSFLNSLKRDQGVAAKLNLVETVAAETATDKTASVLLTSANALLASILTDGVTEKQLNASLSLLAAAFTSDDLFKDADKSVSNLLDAFAAADPRLAEKADLLKAVAKSVASNGAASVASGTAIKLVQSLIAGNEVNASILTSLSLVAGALLGDDASLAGDASVSKLLDALGKAGTGALKPYTDLINAAIGMNVTKTNGSAAANAFIESILSFGPNMSLNDLNEAKANLDASGMAFEINSEAAAALKDAAKAIYDYQRNAGNTTIWNDVSLSSDQYKAYIADPEGSAKAGSQNGTTTPPASGSTTGGLTRPNANALYFQVGANSNQGIYVNIRSVKTDTLGIGDGNGNSKIDVMKETGDQITEQLDTLDRALTFVTSERAKLGAVYNRLDYTQKSLDISSENLSAAESRIRDTDMAKEMMAFTKANVLNQAGISMLSQANQSPQNILSLLR